jgi:undecaprenyl-diphosphatase
LASFLYSIDVAIFRWINTGWSNPKLDAFFTFVTDIHHFYWVLAPLILYWLIWGKAKHRWLVLSLVVGITLSDQISAHILKFIFERIRPCNALPDVLTPAGKSDAFSFPSSHAANMGSSMFLLSMAFQPWIPLFVIIALLVGLSRIYLGLHYPSDVLGGYLIGLLLGYLVWVMVEKLKGMFVVTPVPVQKKKGRKKRG